jgi:hypothetical protein
MTTASVMIPIPKTNNFIQNENIYNKNYLTNLENTPETLRYNVELNQNFFDPSKSSPPNEFMEKLNKRLNVYNTYSTLSSSPVLSAHCLSLFMQESSSEKNNDNFNNT